LFGAAAPARRRGSAAPPNASARPARDTHRANPGDGEDQTRQGLRERYGLLALVIFSLAAWAVLLAWWFGWL
jgi:hypothetical protein